MDHSISLFRFKRGKTTDPSISLFRFKRGKKPCDATEAAVSGPTDWDGGTIPLEVLDLAWYSIYTRAVCEVESLRLQQLLPDHGAAGGVSLLHQGVLIALFEVLAHPQQPAGDGFQLLPGQTPLIQAEFLSSQDLRQIFMLASQVSRCPPIPGFASQPPSLRLSSASLL